jgi:hypothetical protein
VPDTGAAPDPRAENPLLTPKEHEALRRARELRERSEQLVWRAARATRPNHLRHRFPARPAEQN